MCIYIKIMCIGTFYYLKLQDSEGNTLKRKLKQIQLHRKRELFVTAQTGYASYTYF